MKTSTTLLILIGLSGVILPGCNFTSTGELGSAELLGLELTRSAYVPGQAIILRATPNPELGEEFFKNVSLKVSLSGNNEANLSTELVSWQEVSDEEMAVAIKEGLNVVILRIKEAGKENVRDSNGEVVGSEEAVNQFVNWAEEHESLSIKWRDTHFHRYVVIEYLEEPSAETVRQVRTHENVDLMEPDNIGVYFFTTGSSSSDASASAPIEDLVSVILPDDAFPLTAAGEQLTAVFRQGDGTVLETSATIADL